MQDVSPLSIGDLSSYVLEIALQALQSLLFALLVDVSWIM